MSEKKKPGVEAPSIDDFDNIFAAENIDIVPKPAPKKERVRQ